MTVTDLQVAAPLEPKRDQWGRYKIPHPHTGKETAWTRATTVAATLADKFGLQQWSQRMTALGLAKRHDLYARVASCGPEDKSTLNRLVEEAKEAAAASAGANLGTALHRFTERIDSGEEIHAPSPLDADLAAYRRTLVDAGFTVVPGMIEQIVTVPSVLVAGTLDRIGTLAGRNLPLIADLKTGQFLNFGEISLQLALYANAETIFDLRTSTHASMIDVDKSEALVIHLPAGKATCTLWLVDIAAGWEAVQQAVWVREWRKRKNLARALSAPDAASIPQKASGEPSGAVATPPALTTGMVGTVPLSRDSIAARVQALDAIPGAIRRLGKTLKERSIPRLGECNDDELLAYASTVSVVEKQVGADFMPAELAPHAPVQPDPFAGLPTTDGGHHVTASSAPAADERAGAVEPHSTQAPAPALLARYEALPADLREQVDANRAGTVLEGKNIRSRRTKEQAAVADALIAQQEIVHEGRKAYIASLLQGLDDEVVTELAAQLAEGDGIRNLETLTEADVERLEALVADFD